MFDLIQSAMRGNLFSDPYTIAYKAMCKGFSFGLIMHYLHECFPLMGKHELLPAYTRARSMRRWEKRTFPEQVQAA